MDDQVSNASDTVNQVIEILSHHGWMRDSYFYAPEIKEVFPEFNFNDKNKGRGSTIFNVFTSGKMLSVKTAENSCVITTGNKSSVDALVKAANNNVKMNIFLYKSSSNKALMFDLGEILRNHRIKEPNLNGYDRGQAPPVYWKWSSPRTSGSCHGKMKTRIEMENSARAFGMTDLYPYEDNNDNLWIAANKICYRQLVVSISACGLSNWKNVALKDIPDFIKNNW